MNENLRHRAATRSTLATRTAAVLGGAAAMTLAAAMPATAATWAYDDAAGDVTKITYTDESEEITPQPDDTTSDVTRTVIRHRAHRVTMTSTLRDIAADSGLVSFTVRTDDSTYWGMYRLGTSRDLPGFYLERGNGRTVRCPGAERAVDRTSEVATISMPRRCLGYPRWVRVGAGVVTFAPGDNSESFLVDNALGAGFEDLSMSPRVRRG